VAVGRVLPGDDPRAHAGRHGGKSDPLLGLKENVILGKLIPAGTGLPRYRNVKVEPTEEAKAAMYSLPNYDAYDYAGFGTGSGEAIRLDDEAWAWTSSDRRGAG
jgi:hypothetical protein